MENKNETVSSTCVSGEQGKGWACLGVEVYVKVFIIAGLIYWFFNEEISIIVGQWLEDESWSHGFLIPFFSLYFLNQKTDEILSINYSGKLGLSNYAGIVLLIGFLVFYPLNYLQFQIGYFMPLTVIAVLFSVVLLMGGWNLIKYTWLPILYLIFAVPLPDRIHREITIPMREIASMAAASILSLINGMEATARGVIIDVVYNGEQLDPPLNVADACSGMRLLMAFVALGVAMAYLHYRPTWQRIVLLCSTIPIAILCNIVRVTITGLIYVAGNPKYAQGIYHDGLGLLMLPLAFGLYGAIAWFMANLFVDEEVKSNEEVIIKRKNID